MKQDQSKTPELSIAQINALHKGQKENLVLFLGTTGNIRTEEAVDLTFKKFGLRLSSIDTYNLFCEGSDLRVSRGLSLEPEPC